MSQTALHFRFRVSLTSMYLLFLSGFCFSLLTLRMLYTGTFEYRFMGINLLLAWIPWYFANTLAGTGPGRNTFLKPILFFLWLIFFPNAAYMITDLIHLPEFPSAPVWFDCIMLLSFAWCGVLLGLYSLQKLHAGYLANTSRRFRLLLIFSLFFLCGIGIYLGRFERWNSWDLLVKPATMIRAFTQLVTDPQSLLTMLAMAFVFAGFLSILYLKLMPGINKNKAGM